MTSPLDTPDQPGDEPLDALDEDRTGFDEEPEQGAGEEESDEEVAEEPAAPARSARPTKTDRGRAKAPATAPAVQPPVETLRYVDDVVSKRWVVVICAAFAAVFLYGILLGTGGVLTPYHSPTPQPTPAPSAAVSATPAASSAVSAAPSASVEVSAAPSEAPSAVPSAAPSATPSPAPSVASPSPS